MGFRQRQEYDINLLDPGGAINTFAYTATHTAGGGYIAVSETIATSTTDKEIAFVLDVGTGVKSFAMWCDKDILVETNTSGGVESISLTANQPYLWQTTISYEAFIFTTDITKLFVTTGAVGNAEFNIRCTYDVTI